MSGFTWFVVLWIAVSLGIVVVPAARQWYLEWKRRKALERLAEELGLRYVRRDPSIAKDFRCLDALRKGRGRYALNVLRGTYQGYSVQVFDYPYQSASVRTQGWPSASGWFFSVLLLELEKEFPELRIYPTSVLSKLGKMLGLQSIEFESVEFSQAFAVKSADRKFAYDICHQRMIEYLLEHQDVSLEVEDRYVAVSLPRRLAPWEIRRWLSRLVEIRELFPEYLYRN